MAAARWSSIRRIPTTCMPSRCRCGRTHSSAPSTSSGGVTWNTILATTNKITAPLVLDSVNPDRLLVGGGFLLESVDQGGELDET